MNIFIKVDSSNTIGTGHIIRCLKLAKYFENHNIFFICKKFIGNLNKKVSENNFKLFELDIEKDNSIISNVSTWLGESVDNDAYKTINILKQYNVDLLIIDQYAIDYKWQTLVKTYIKKLIVIDDYIERVHNCDIIINSIEDDPKKYENYCNDECKLLLGSEYFIISKEFLNIAKHKKFNENIKRIFIFISGSDTYNYTYKICENIVSKFNNIIFDILIGGSNKNYKKIEKLCEDNINFNYYYNVENVHEIMFKADLCIGSLGQNFIERLVLGIPSIVFTIADNQLGFLDKYKDKNLFLYCGYKITNMNIISEKINYLLENNSVYNNLLKNCLKEYKSNKLDNRLLLI